VRTEGIGGFAHGRKKEVEVTSRPIREEASKRVCGAF
jgi:hypothetical protein